MICYILALLLSFLIARSEATSESILSPSGIQVSKKLITTHLAKVPDHHLHHYLHEITPELQFLSHSTVIDLKDKLGSPEPLPSLEAPVYIDGKLSTTRPSGFIRRGIKNNWAYSLATAEDGSVVFVQVPGKSLKPVDLNKYPGLFVHVPTLDEDVEVATYDDAPQDVPVGVEQLSSSRLKTSVTMVEPSCRGPLAPPQSVELAIAADSFLCAVYSSSAAMELAIRSVVCTAESYYKNEMCIRFTITHVDFHCDASTDPYRIIPSDSNPMDPFRDIWMTGPNANARRHVALFFTGYNREKIAGQVKAIGATCIEELSFAWLDRITPLVLAHELGHNLGGRHVTSGIMRPSKIDGPYFSDESIDQIVSFVDSESVASICIQRTANSESSPCPSPPASPSPPNTQTCKELLGENESFLCSRAQKVSATVSTTSGGISLTIPLQVKFQNKYGILFSVTAPEFANVADGSQRRMFLSDMRLLVRFTSVNVSSWTAPYLRTKRKGQTLIGIADVGDIVAAPGLTSCCGEKMKVVALLRFHVFESDMIIRFTKYLTWSVRFSCQTFRCMGLFKPMSHIQACPKCIGKEF